MSKFTYAADIPPSIKRELAKAVKPYGWLIPSWCQLVQVNWHPTGKDTILISCAIMYEYRQAELTFYPLFLSEPEDRRKEHVIHDMLHIFMSVVSDYAYATIDRLVPEEEAPKFREALLDELRQRNESCVQDLAHCLNLHLTP